MSQKKGNTKFLGKTTKVGTYTLVMALIVLAVIAVINLVVLKLPSKYTKHDITSLNLYTLSDTTKEAIPKISDDITIYLLCEDGKDNSGSALNNIPNLSLFLSKYTDLNPHLKVSIIDPVAKPNFQNTYTQDELDNYTIIIESGKRFKIVNFGDLYYYYSNSYGRMTAEEYNQYSAYMQYYGNDGSVTLYFDGESVITSALDFVTTDELPVLYALDGHGEVEFSDTLINTIETENMTIEKLSLLTQDIPADAECVIINTPTSDINTDEAAKLDAYLNGGGHMFVTTVYAYLDLPNLMGVLQKYGVTAQEGMIIEGSQNNYYSGYPYYLLPETSQSSEITKVLSSYRMFMPYSHGILETSSKPDTVTVTPLFTTSTSAYTISAESQSMEKDENSVTGKFNLAVSVSDSATNAKIVWVAAPVFTDNFNSVTKGNYMYLTSMLNWMSERERIVENIPSTSLESASLVVSESSANLFAALLIVIIPLAFAVAGLVRWYIRRKR